MSAHRTLSCDELHALVSYRLDGAISQFERALAAAHLRECPACARFEAEVGAFTRLLRDAELVTPRHRVRVSYAARYRRSARMLRGAVATAAVAVAAVAIGGSVRVDDGAFRAAIPPANDAVRTAGPPVVHTRLVPLQELYREDLSRGLLPVVGRLADDSLGAVKPALPAGTA